MPSVSSPYRPRKKKKGQDSLLVNSSQSAITISPTADNQSPAFPLAAFFWPARKSTPQWVVLPLILMAVGLFRWVVGFWGYSGFQTPPMYGDFEAQRHWMEITAHLPMSQWYFYDLPYWGLDYPPLTAYHSWLLGKIGCIINPSWFALDTSRGIENQLLKVYMRSTVLVSEYLVYIPAAIIFTRRLSRLRSVSAWENSMALVAILMQPANILVDHGHFQYNTVMLGFVLASMSSILAGRLLWGCVFFVAALCFKQMALYYAPAVFAYLLGVCIHPKPNLLRFTAISAITVASFATMFAPLLIGSLFEHIQDPSLIIDTRPPPILASLLSKVDSRSWASPIFLQLAQCIHRIFPFARGIFEDKVANMWCVIHTGYKLNSFPMPMLQRTSLSATLISILPACMAISYSPRKELLPLAMASCAWGFFLCSFQVHEKSVLLPLLPMTVLLASDKGLGPEKRAWIGWANLLGAWTLFPLLKRDELRIPYTVLTLLWAFLLGLPPTSINLYMPSQPGLFAPTKFLHLAFYAAMLVWHGLEALIPTPAGKPDLWVVINILIGAAGFGICWLWCTWQLILTSGIMEDYFGVRIRLNAATNQNGKLKQKKTQ